MKSPSAAMYGSKDCGEVSCSDPSLGTQGNPASVLSDTAQQCNSQPAFSNFLFLCKLASHRLLFFVAIGSDPCAFWNR
jgi:hypothetical protein